MNRTRTESGLKPAIDLVTQHSFLWLVIVNVCGLLLATLLLFPSLGVILQPLTYGRWVSVHLNASLYGWSSLPMIGLLFYQYLPVRASTRLAWWAVTIWSAVLLFAMTGWLAGHTSGKLFMEWTGASRWGISLSMGVLAAALWRGLLLRMREEKSVGATTPGARSIAFIKVVVLLLLSFLPVVMYAAADPSLYPPINPDSGGATGGSLLGSTLMLVLIFLITPFMLSLKPTVPPVRFVAVGAALLVHMMAFALLDHGDRSHHEWSQVVALSSLIVWVPLLIRHLRFFEWPAGSSRWLAAFAVWGGALTVNGIATFFPHILEQWKFTNALVAHVHIAMAGMITSFNMLVLVVLNASEGGVRVGHDPRTFWWWQVALVVHALSLLIAGTVEAMHPSWLFTSHPVVQGLYAVRWAAGLVMTVASFLWLRAAHNHSKGYP